MEGSCCSKGHEVPDLQQVIRTLGLVERELLNVYIVGSHLWGTCGHGSDWDMVIIVEDPTGARRPLNTHRGNFEAFIVSRDCYTSLIREHAMQVLITLWLPRALVLRENFDPKILFHLDPTALMSSLEHTRERDLRVSEKHFRKSNTIQAKKVLVHCLRYLMLGVQVKRSGHIHDYAVGHPFRELVLESYCTTWEELMAVVQQVVDQTWAEITA